MSTVRRASLPAATNNFTNNGSRRSREGLRTKTPSVNDLSKKFKNTPKGKRRLEFQTKLPLKDKKFYLDLKGYKKIPSLAARIKELGGKVEEFLSKDITYLITNRKDADTRLSPRSNSTPSPGMSIPSPFPANKSSSIKASAWPSPLSADSPQSIDAHQLVPKHDTRGKTLRKQATLSYTNKFGTSDILTNARTWGINVIHLDRVLEKLEEYRPSSAVQQPSIKELMGSGKKELRVKIRKLQVPFIKVEDQSRNYKPLVKEFKEWPLPDFNSPVGTCPFDSPKRKKESELKKKNEKENQDVKKQSKKGFCECCCLHYDALDLHLKSDHHKSFAANDSNYESLDKLISQGPSLKIFLKKIKRKHSSISGNTKPISENQDENPFQTPTKDSMNSVNDEIDSKNNKQTNEELISNNNDKSTREENEDERDFESKTNNLKENPQPIGENIEQGNFEGLPKKRATRSQFSPEHVLKSDTNADFGEMKIERNPTKSLSPQIKRNALKCANHEDQECKVEKGISSLVDVTEIPTKKDPSPDGELNEEIKKKESETHEDPATSICFTSLKPHKTGACDSEGNKRVLRSQRKNDCSSESTETLSSVEGMRHLPVFLCNRTNSCNESSTDTMSEVRNEVDESGMLNGASKPCTSEQHNLSKRNDPGKAQEENVSLPVQGTQISSSPPSVLSARKTEFYPGEHSLTDNEYIDSDGSTKAEAGSSYCPKPRSSHPAMSKLPGKDSRKEIQSSFDSGDKAAKENGKEVTFLTTENNEIPKCDTEGACNFDKSVQTKDETFTSLFDSDDDDDKSFEGFEVPHFGDSRSSEQDFSYRIKEIIEYFTESQDDTLVNASDGAVDDEERSGPTDGTEKLLTKEKRQPHGIKIILSSRTDDGDDSVFEDVEEEEQEEEEGGVEDDSSCTVADSTDGEDEELSLSSALCMEPFTYKRKSCNLDDSEISFQIPPKRRRTTTDDENPSRHLLKDTEVPSEPIDCDIEMRQETRPSTTLLTDKEKTNQAEDDENKKTTRKTRASTRLSGFQKTLYHEKNSEDISMEDVFQNDCNMKATIRKNRTSTRMSSTKKNMSDQERTSEDISMKVVSQDDCNKETKSKSRVSTRISKTEKAALDPDKDSIAVLENVSQDDYNKRRRNKARTSTRMSRIKTKTSNPDESEDECSKRVTRSKGGKKDLSNKKDDNDKKENVIPADNNVSPGKTKTEERTRKTKTKGPTSKDLSSSVVEEASCASDNSFFKDFSPELINLLSVTMTIEERVKLRTRNKLLCKSEALSTLRDFTDNKITIQDQKKKDDLRIVIDNDTKAKLREKKDRAFSTSCLTEKCRILSSVKEETKTDSTNTAEVGSSTRLRSRSHNQSMQTPKSSSIKNLNMAASNKSFDEVSSPLPLQRKTMCSTTSLKDSSPITTPLRTHRPWIFDPGHFSASTPQPSRKAKSRISLRVEKSNDKSMTTRSLRNTNKCLIAGDSYEFIDEDVYAFDD